jgi:hypothetical protein
MNRKMRFMSSFVSPAIEDRGANLQAQAQFSSRCHDDLSGYWALVNSACQSALWRRRENT